MPTNDERSNAMRDFDKEREQFDREFEATGRMIRRGGCAALGCYAVAGLLVLVVLALLGFWVGRQAGLW
jgi:hypothetical protein